MPKYYCEYCDIFLTHDSSSVRKAHNAGKNHIANWKNHYMNAVDPVVKQGIMDDIIKAYKDANLPLPAPSYPPGPMPMGFPPRPPFPMGRPPYPPPPHMMGGRPPGPFPPGPQGPPGPPGMGQGMRPPFPGPRPPMQGGDGPMSQPWSSRPPPPPPPSSS